MLSALKAHLRPAVAARQEPGKADLRLIQINTEHRLTAYAFGYEAVSGRVRTLN